MPSKPSTHYIVYADDDTDDLDLMRECFEKHAQNVEILTFENGQEAMTFLHNLHPTEPLPCLVILDINMPLITGWEVVQKLRAKKRFENMPIVLFTTSSQPHDKHLARQYNAGFITKPLNYRQMDIIADTFIDFCTDDVKKVIRKGVS